jgi:hypothetical protein
LPTTAPALANNLANSERETDEEVFLLPGGYVDESGKVHDEVQLAPLTGLDEEALLGSLDPGTCAASVVTSLLSRCVKRVGSLDGVDASLIRELLVADRDYLIVKLRLLTLGPRVDCVLRCPDPNCGELMDLTFNLDELEFERKPVKQRYVTIQLLHGAAEFQSEQLTGSVDVRFPNGADQEACAPLFTIDKETALAELLSRCIRRVDNCSTVDRAKMSGLDRAVRLEIEERLRQLAPQTEIELEASCPECEKSFGAGFDALTFLLREIISSVRSVEHDVHYLAWHYHWSEREILSMTRRKRQRYVALVQEEVDRVNGVR